MCPVNNPIVPPVAPPIAPPIAPPVVPPIAPPVVPPQLQLTPIMDGRGLPIANQEWNGTEYVRVTTNTRFIRLTTSTDTQITPFLAHVTHPVINPIINTAFIFTYIMAQSLGTTLTAAPLQNFGNSCYFNVSIQLLFKTAVATNGRHGTNYISPTLTNLNKIRAYSDIANLFNLMRINNTPINNTMFLGYLFVKQQFIGNNLPQEEDAEEFITRYFTDLDPSLINDFLITGTTISYYALNSIDLMRDVPYDSIIYDIDLSVIQNNPNADIVSMIDLNHRLLTLQEGVEAISDSATGDFVFGYRFRRIDTLPEYLFIRLNMIDPTTMTKFNNNAQIRQAISLMNNAGNVTNYSLYGIIIHRGNDIHHGHYTCLVFDRFNNPNIEYLFYDDAVPPVWSSFRYDMQFIPSAYYIQTPLDTPYIILYKRF